MANRVEPRFYPLYSGIDPQWYTDQRKQIKAARSEKIAFDLWGSGISFSILAYILIGLITVLLLSMMVVTIKNRLLIQRTKEEVIKTVTDAK